MASYLDVLMGLLDPDRGVAAPAPTGISGVQAPASGGIQGLSVPQFGSLGGVQLADTGALFGGAVQPSDPGGMLGLFGRGGILPFDPRSPAEKIAEKHPAQKPPAAPGATPAAPVSPEQAAQISLSGLGPGQRQEFLRRAVQVGHVVEAESGIPAELLAAMAANESNFGNAAGNIMGGVKADPSDPNAVWHQTWEMVNGQRVQMMQPFVASATPLEGMRRVAQTLSSGRYANAYQRLRAGELTAQQFIEQVNAAGYATNPNWAAGEIAPLMGEARQYRAQPLTAAAAGTGQRVARGQVVPQGASVLFGGAPAYVLTEHRAPMPGHPVPHHRGIDLRAADGTNGSTYGLPVHATVGGNVIYAGQESYGGYGVIMQGDDGQYHHYYHLQPQGRPAVGARLDRGQQLGQVGWATPGSDSHLHYEVASSGAAQRMDADPWPTATGR